MAKLDDLKKKFRDKDLLILAITHKSWVNEHPGKRESNERLEFLGDAVLEFVTSQELYKKFPDKEEGYLTALRANLVNTVSLASVAKKLGLGELLLLSKGEEQEGGRENPSLLANTIEAIIGAFFLDQGTKRASKFIEENILSELPNIVSRPLKDTKSRLQELVQARGFATPKYEVVGESGPDHAKKFLVEVLVDKKAWGKGEGKNKSQAEQAAAKKALESNL
ncbi:ribonuclease III [Patescibacteria group bacterium]|nr:ribonuclease III [Patescibacteria group bacterium]